METNKQIKRPLQACIFVDSLTQQAWVDKAIRDLVGLGIFDVSLIVKCSGSLNRLPTTSGLIGLYAKFDRYKNKPIFNALADADISWLLEKSKILDVQLLLEKGEITLGTSTLQAISDYQPDVVISFLSTCPTDISECKSIFGSWFFSIGSSFQHPGLLEVLECKDVTPVQLVSADNSGDYKLLCQCMGSTETYSWNQNLNASSWKLASLLKRAVQRIYEYGNEGLNIENSNLSIYKKNIPTGLRLISLIIKLVSRNLWMSISWRLYRESWFSAFRFFQGNNALESLNNLTPMQQPNDTFWADPFPIMTDDGFVVFVEEAKYSDKRGRISVLCLDETGKCIKHQVALEQSFHMSYPFVFHYDNALYMVPQSANHGQVEMFRCTDFPNKWEYHSTLLSGEKFSDTSLLEYNGKWWLFTTPSTKEILPMDDLLIYHSQTPFGPWLAHRRNPVISDARYARPAGRPFAMNGKFFRPVQDCSFGEYGRAITIREIVTLNEDEFIERDYLRIDPTWTRGVYKTHTFNFDGNVLVLDGCRRIWRKWSK